VRALFGAWRTDRVLLKPSFTYGGKGVRVFTRSAVWRLRWKPELDVFCPEINPDDGDVYKAELLNGRVLISWKSAAPPVRLFFQHGIHRGLRGAYGERSLWEPPANLTAKLEALSQRLTSDGLSHVSLDLMRRANGELVAIELNTSGVATWWTRQFSGFRDRYTDALYELAIRHGLKSQFQFDEESKPHRCCFCCPRTLPLETNGCILLIASYYLLKNICHIEALEDVFP